MGGTNSKNNSSKRANSRGKTQISSSSKQQALGRENQSLPAHLRWSQIDDNTGSQGHLMLSPDPLLSKNSKAMAQLAPLTNNPASLMGPLNFDTSTTKQAHLPSLEEL